MPTEGRVLGRLSDPGVRERNQEWGWPRELCTPPQAGFPLCPANSTQGTCWGVESPKKLSLRVLGNRKPGKVVTL